MRSYQVTKYEGELLGPIDWTYDFNQHAWSEHQGGLNPACIPGWVEMLRKIEHGSWKARISSSSRFFSIIAVGMYDGWPHWKPTPSFCISSVLGPEWHPFYSLGEIEIDVSADVKKPEAPSQSVDAGD